MRFIRLMLISIIALSAACSGSGGDVTAAREFDLAAFELELSSLPLPDGVDPALWASLKDELRSAMTKAASERAVSLAPESDWSTVQNFAVTAEIDGAATFGWTYRNQGDYNQDKLVGVSDLTPIGVFFNAKEGDADWDEAQLADGDRNGLITVSDITPIGQNYLRRVEGYRIYRGGTPGVPDGWQELSSVLFEDGGIPEGEYWHRMSYVDPAPVDDAFYRVTPYDGEHLGNPSNYSQFSFMTPMVTVHVPEVLLGGIEADWSAEWENGTGPYTISWEFGGGADDIAPVESESPDEQTVLMINESRADSASYSYTVTVEDSLGVAGIATGDYIVSANPHPAVIVIVPEDLQSHELVQWQVAWSDGIAPYTLSWDFGGGAENPDPLENAVSPRNCYAVMLNESETESADYTYTVTVTDSLGYAGIATGEYTVGSLEPIVVTVEVPGSMQGGESADWTASWSHGAPSFEISWDFGGGASDSLNGTDSLSDDQRRRMINDSRTESAQYNYTVTVTDSLGLTGMTSGEYTVGPNPSPLVTVTVPENMNGGEDAEWTAEWIAGTPPYEIYWDFNGGAADIDWEEATSPDSRTVEMFNPSMTSDTQYVYMVRVVDSLGYEGRAEWTYSVGPGPNLAPEIRSAWFEYATDTLYVDARDVNTEDTLSIAVTEPAGFHVDETPKEYPTRLVMAEFSWTADEPADGRYGTTHITLEDALGLSDETDVFIAFLEPDTLYAIPLKTSVQVGEPVRIVIATGALPNPFFDLCLASVTVEDGAAMVVDSVNAGAVGGDSADLDGIWTSLNPPLLVSSFYLAGGVDIGGGRRRWELFVHPLPSEDLMSAAGDLLNFEFTFTAAGAYVLGFQDITGTVGRTYYSDWDEYEYYWGDITNEHEGFANSIVVTE